MSQRFPMTVAGETALREELNHLKSVQRPQVIEAIAEARAHGDLKENAEYHAAREQQGFIEGRISEIEAKLAACQVIDISKIPNDGKVLFGTTVTIIDTEDEQEKKYQIVGEDEADTKQGKISVTSPIARGLIGKMIGDVVQIQTPGGVQEFEIDAVEHQ